MGETIIVYDANGNQISPKLNVVEKLYNSITVKDIAAYLRQIPTYIEIIKGLIPTETVKLVFSKQTQDMINAGATFGNSKYGGFASNLFDSAGKLVGSASFTKEISRAFSPSLFSSINNIVLQQQFSEIIALLDSITANVEQILAGQQNDRIAMCLSAEQYLSDALKINDSSLQRQMMANVLQTAHQARGALTQTFAKDVQTLKSYKVSWSQNYEKKIRPMTQAIKESIIANYRATKICAIAYSKLEEYDAMVQTLSTYRELLNSRLPQNTLEKLNDIDSESNGFWLTEPKKMSMEIEKYISSSDSVAVEFPVSLLLGEC